jgi:mRNA-degrading endonuclease toxin of MazEF toxin-antitoxin module
VTSPFRPGTVFYADVPESHVLANETRNNPDLGPRPWLVLYSRHHAQTGVVMAAPLYSKGDASITSHVACGAEDFDTLRDDAGGRLRSGWIHLEQSRALDKARLDNQRGPLGSLKGPALAKVRAKLMGMLDPRLGG